MSISKTRWHLTTSIDISFQDLVEIDAFDATKLLTEESEQGATKVAGKVAERCGDDGFSVQKSWRGHGGSMLRHSGKDELKFSKSI